jgi:protein-S-isoprenylcysteine O-methyltransferase Ste14
LRWTDVTLIAGIFMCLAGLVLTVRQASRRREQARRRSASYVERIGDLASQAVVFGGVALVQFGNVAKHVSERTLPANLWLSLASSTSVLLVFGVLLGRLHMRWQLRRLLAVLDTESSRS